ncbi:hypothetical protein E1A91_A05G394000v1 [Gossypium mustelinum]|uniref:Uncharacterized protein n=1 Tax=Gossypium mustelinum TaxID=34275 RepID=A0A5D2ZIZ7_GOSMU|nr:hypothetical protein E1A91_A05G394000v1 [Gossypium mustelinum]
MSYPHYLEKQKKRRQRVFFALPSLPMSGDRISRGPLRRRCGPKKKEANEGAMRRVEEATVRDVVAEVVCAVVQHAWGERRLKKEAKVAETIWVVGLGLVLGLLGLGL